MGFKERALWFLAGLFCAGIIGYLYPPLMLWIVLFSLAGVVLLLWQMRKKDVFTPRSKTFKTIEKIQKKREKIATDKHHHINDQINYIEVQWGYTQEQKRVIVHFIEQRAYSEMYNKFTASLLPQLITLIENCNNREQKGCKREVSRRIKELTLIMKEELKRKKSQSKESFETTLEVYDHLLNEVK